MIMREQFVFVNPFRGLAGAFLLLAFVFLAVGTSSALTVGRLGGVLGKPMTDLQTGWAVTAAMGLIGTVAMLIGAACVVPSARKTERTLAEFRNGHCLAHWTFTNEQWQAYIELLPRLRPKGQRWFLIFFQIVVTMILVAFLGLFGWLIIVAARMTANAAGIEWTVSAMGVPAACLVLLAVFFTRFLREGRERRLASPWACIGRDAVYCGGDFNYWGSHTVALHDARLLPESPAIVELVIGPNERAQQIATAVSLLGRFAGHAVPTSAQNQRRRCYVPVPAGAEAEAENLVKTLKRLTGK